LKAIKRQSKNSLQLRKSFDDEYVPMNTENTKTLEELLKNYNPAPQEYDPEIDGGDEYLIRDQHLEEKERLKDVITKLKEKNRGDRKVRR
jgi:hypothetical protein